MKILIKGDTQTGKTYLAKLLIDNATKKYNEIKLIDSHLHLSNSNFLSLVNKEIKKPRYHDYIVVVEQHKQKLDQSNFDLVIENSIPIKKSETETI